MKDFSGGLILILVALVVLFVAVTGKFDCFTTFFSCLINQPLATSEPPVGSGTDPAGLFGAIPGGNGFMGGFGFDPQRFPGFGGGGFGGFGTPPTFGGGGGFAGFGDGFGMDFPF